MPPNLMGSSSGIARKLLMVGHANARSAPARGVSEHAPPTICECFWCTVEIFYYSTNISQKNVNITSKLFFCFCLWKQIGEQHHQAKDSLIALFQLKGLQGQPAAVESW